MAGAGCGGLGRHCFAVSVPLIDKRDNTCSQLYWMWLAHLQPPYLPQGLEITPYCPSSDTFVPLVLGRAFLSLNQIAHRLMHCIRNPDGYQLPGAKQAGQSNCIQPVCLNAITGTHRTQRGRNNTACETERTHLPICNVGDVARHLFMSL